jgi:hypothetical protein
VRSRHGAGARPLPRGFVRGDLLLPPALRRVSYRVRVCPVAGGASRWVAVCAAVDARGACDAAAARVAARASLCCRCAINASARANPTSSACGALSASSSHGRTRANDCSVWPAAAQRCLPTASNGGALLLLRWR